MPHSASGWRTPAHTGPHSRQSVEGEARKLRDAYANVLAKDYRKWASDWESKNGKKLGGLVYAI